MTAITTSIRKDAPIREHLDTLAQAIRAKEIDALMEHYAQDNVTFDLTPPLQVQGVDAYRKNFEAWFTSVQGRIGYDIRDLQIRMSDVLAFCHHLGHVRITRKTGEKADYWVRVTTGLQRLNGRWMVIHEHVSMPFNMETMQAAVDVQP